MSEYIQKMLKISIHFCLRVRSNAVISLTLMRNGNLICGCCCRFCFNCTYLVVNECKYYGALLVLLIFWYSTVVTFIVFVVAGVIIAAILIQLPTSCFDISIFVSSHSHSHSHFCQCSNMDLQFQAKFSPRRLYSSLLYHIVLPTNYHRNSATYILYARIYCHFFCFDENVLYFC